jgi:hypothetical protein
MGTMEDIKKAKDKFTTQTGHQSVTPGKKKPWLTYKLEDDNARRSRSRRHLHITSVLKEVGYPVKTCYTAETLIKMCGKLGIEIKEKNSDKPGIEEKEINNVAVIEFTKLTEDLKNEILKFLGSRKVKIIKSLEHKYEDDVIVSRIYVYSSSIKETN